MTTVEIIAILGATAPFDRLTAAERERVAGVMRQMHYLPNSLIQPAGEPLGRLLLRVDGEWLADGRRMPPILGVEALVNSTAFAADLMAGPSDVNCLALSKGHFFTVMNQCPAVLLALLGRADMPAQEREFR